MSTSPHHTLASITVKRSLGSPPADGILTGQGWEVGTALPGIEDGLLDAAEYIFDAIEWPGVVLLMAVESAAIPFPSEIIMPLAGWFLIEDRGLSYHWLFLAAFYGALGNTIGSLIAYYAGALGGRPLLLRYGRYVLISQRELDFAEAWFRRFGEATVFFSRLLPVIRTFISVPAGIARMNVWRFTVLTFVGSFPWSLALAWGGFALGDNFERLADWFRPVAIPIAAILLLLIAFFFYRRIREAMRRPQAPALSEEDPDQDDTDQEDHDNEAQI